MLILSSTDVLQVYLSGSVTTNQLRCIASYREIDTSTYSPSNAAVLTNNATPVTLVGSPASGYKRVIDYISIHNTDTTANTVTIVLDVSSTDYILAVVTLGTNERLEYVEGAGFRVLTVDGSLKNSLNQGVNSPISGYQRVTLGSDVVNNNGTANTIANITGLQIALTSGQRMWFKFVIRYLSAATGTGARFSINGPTNDELQYRSDYSLTTTSRTFNDGLTAYDLPAASNATSAATTGNLAVVEGIVRPTANGNLIARFASEVSSSAITAKAGSFVDYGPI